MATSTKHDQSAYNAAYYARHKKKIREQRISYRQNNREKVRAVHVLRAYGLSAEEHGALLSSQNGCCAICRSAPRNKPLYVDHDHRTGKARGLLCNRCNTGLGAFSDTADGLKKALSYLES